jgi:hypothetical protein
MASSTNCCADSRLYNPGIAIQFTTWLQPSATFTTKYFFIAEKPLFAACGEGGNRRLHSLLS